MSKHIGLPTSFFERHAVIVAQDLLGKTLVFSSFEGVITETEAYRGLDDPASHAFRGPTPRAKVMFGPAGFSYVYFIYGMYHCLNIVTEPEGSPSAVLLRGLKIGKLHLNGPGKLCKYFGISKAHNQMNICEDLSFCVLDKPHPHFQTLTTPRIGIKQGLDKAWRFVMVNEV